MKLNTSRKLLSSFLIAAIATVAAFAIMQLSLARDVEDKLYDIRELAFAPKTPASEDIVIILLDEQTMKDLPYRSPIPRNFLAGLHKKIAAANPRLIAYDIFFKDPSFEADDLSLARAMKEDRTYSVVPGRADGTADHPMPLFEKSIVGSGLADLPLNALDTIVRKARLSFNIDGKKVPSFAALLYAAAAGKNAEAEVAAASASVPAAKSAFTPFAGGGDIYIRFAGPPGKSFKTYSAAMVAKGLVPASWLAGKIVLVGAGYEDLKDSYLTPYFAASTGYAKMNGVEIHANILSSLLTKSFYFAPKPLHVWASVIFFAFIVALASVWLRPAGASIAFVAVAAAIALRSVLAFHFFGIVCPVVSPLAASAFAYCAGLGFMALTEGRQKRFIKGAFAQYVPRAVVERMTEHPELLKLGGEERHVTSMFTDIASFTSISEKMRPQDLVQFLNEYLGRMNSILFEFGATLDKYEGDAIIAFFNAPLNVAEHEAAAARAAIRIVHASAELSEEWSARLGREIVTRIGLATGAAVVGNMGSSGRFDYTAIGDTINLASRLEGANKFYGTKILAAESTAGALNDEIVTRPVDRVRVKGKTKPVLLCEIMGDKAWVEREGKLRMVGSYREAFSAFEKRNVLSARSMLSTIVSKFPDDIPSQKLMERCERAEVEKDWDLVTELTSK